MKKKHILLLILLAAALTVGLCGCSKKPVVGVAWRSNQESESFVATCEAIKAAGGTPVVIPQVMSADLDYEDGMLEGATDGDGVLTPEAVRLVRSNTWQGSNAEEVMKGINAIVFPGGEDICPTLYYDPQPTETAEGYSAERDVSDFLLMSYCLEKDIPILAICRGMQMLSVVSGADMIQDIPSYMESKGKSKVHVHREEPEDPDDPRDFVFHDVSVTDKDSLLYSLIGESTVRNAPSWHHQAVKNVEGTRLKVTAVTDTAGTDMIEAVERPDKSFVLGLQYHPEIAVVRSLDDSSIIYFKAIVDKARQAE